MSAQPMSRYVFGSLPWYSFLIVCGIILALFIAFREEKKQNLPKDTMIDLVLWMLPCAIIGARLYYVIFSWHEYASDPIRILYIWEGGLAIYGGILAGLLAVCLFCKKRKLNVLSICDIIVPGLALAQGIGRWGNYFNMEAFGLEITDPSWMFFPAGVLINEGGQQIWHMATFFYESVFDILIGLFLLLGRHRFLNKKKGDVLFAYILLYGSARLMTEHFRTDSLFSISGSFRVSQLLSVFMCLAVVCLILWRTLKPYVVKLSSGKKIFSVIVLVLITILLLCFYPYNDPTELFMGYNLSILCIVWLCLTGAILTLITTNLNHIISSICTASTAIFSYIFNIEAAHQAQSSFKTVLVRLAVFSLLCIIAYSSYYFRKEAALICRHQK